MAPVASRCSEGICLSRTSAMARSANMTPPRERRLTLRSCRGLNGPIGIAVSGGNLSVTSQVFGQDTGTIGEYTILGETVNTRLIAGLSEPVGIAVVSGSVPDASSTWTLLLMGLMVIFGINLVRHQLA